MSFLIMDLEGFCLSEEDIELLEHPAIAGVILFQRNYQDISQLDQLLKAIRNTKRGHELLISVDQEGGRVQRFKTPFTNLPPPATLTSQITASADARELCQDLGWLMASELKAIGIDISFAPVLDVDIGLSTVIGSRSYGADADTVITMSSAYITGMKEAGMSATGKHFPGHGGIAADSHLTSPVDNRDYDALYKTELRVFEALINNGISGLMPSHVIYSKIDLSPACFSKFWLKTILREQFHFDGCVFSDDLSMQGAVVIGSAAERAHIALKAGCDVLLCCNDRTALISIVDNVEAIDNDARERRIKAMKGKRTQNGSVLALHNLHESSRYKDINKRLAELDY